MKTITYDVTQPFLTGVNVHYAQGKLFFYITLSSKHMQNCTAEQHTNYTLTYNNVTLQNELWRKALLIGCNQLNFVATPPKPFVEGEKVVFTLTNLIQHRVYSNVTACVHIPPPKRLPVISCSYICDYNTVDELKSFVAFQRMSNISMVVFYLVTPIPFLHEALAKSISEGYVRVVDFSWPRANTRIRPVQNNQQAQYNTCFYQFKYDADAIILCDVDEYIYSELFTGNMPRVVQYLRRTRPEQNVFTVSFDSLFHCRWFPTCTPMPGET